MGSVSQVPTGSRIPLQTTLLSIFGLLTGHTYDIYLTSTNPQHTRFYILHAPDTETVRLAVYYHSPQRLDIFADNTYIYPTNAVIEDDGNYKLEVSQSYPLLV